MRWPKLKSFPYNNHLRRCKSSFKLSDSSKTYLPNTFEDEFYKLWIEKGCFQPKEEKHVFSMLLPPPNVTGTLHLGHALTVTIQDTLARWRRMCGKEVVWVPGIDHAGIATQSVVEKFLERDGISRLSLGREKFVEEVWKWKDRKSSIIRDQLVALGSSVDWTKEYFTMDDAQSKAVIEALLLLWNKGLIYRDEILVNWSPHLRSSISDIEVNKIEIDGPTKLSLPGYDKHVEFGKLIDFAYKVVDSDEEIVVSTTRIETMLGDVAVAVNPKDERFRHLWGSVLLHPFTSAEIPLVLDYNVNPNFGSGALKITPAHDRTDFLIGKSHNLPIVSVIGEDGTLINCGSFSGLKRFEAREKICNALAEKGLLRDNRPYKMNIPVCSRSGDVIELLIKPQWFLKSKGMAERAISAVKENKLIITPERYITTWCNWLENIEDWCISRQLWWGHQVPFYRCDGDGKQVWFAAKTEEDAREIAKNAFSCPVTVSRGPDVLDTWFSSALLPFSCFGWPQKNGHLERYYPLSTLVTGNDILFFWVARMVMLSLELTNQIPFKEIFLHGIICDSQGRKMSKSLGNVIQPEDIIKGMPLESLKERINNSFLSDTEIKRAKDELLKLYPNGISECGVDALRFTLLSFNIENQNINFDVKECEGAKRFCNKLWQVCNFTNIWLGKFSVKGPLSDDRTKSEHLMDKWILLRFASVVGVINESLPRGDFHLATTALRNFIHHDLCDVYVESIKPLLQRGELETVTDTLNTLQYVLESSIKCLSPFMPFITEQLYHMLPGIKEEKSLMEMAYPSEDLKKIDNSVLERVSFALNIVNTIRRLKHNVGIGDKQTQIWLECSTSLLDIKDVMEALGRCKIDLGKPPLDKHVCKTESFNEEILVSLDLRDCQPRPDESLQSLTKKNEKMKKDLEKMLKMTSNEGYKQVSPEIQKVHKEKIFKLKTEIHKIDSLLEKKAVNI